MSELTLRITHLRENEALGSELSEDVVLHFFDSVFQFANGHVRCGLDRKDFFVSLHKTPKLEEIGHFS
jgi:hypothetical protein